MGEDWSTLLTASSQLNRIAAIIKPVPDQGTRTPDRDTLRVELQEALGSVRHWQVQAVQTAGFILAANIVLIGYGFSQKHAGMFLIGSALPLILLGCTLLVFLPLPIKLPLRYGLRMSFTFARRSL